MDISLGKDVAAREDEGTVVHLKDAAGELAYYGDKNDQPVTMTVVGTYSTRYRRALDAQRDRAIKRRGANVDGATVGRDATDLLASCVIAWEGIESNGAPLPFSKANVAAVLDACPWIREDVERASNDHAAFFSRS